MGTNYKQVYAIRNDWKIKLKNKYPELQNRSGIYILTRFEEDFKYVYVGQSVNVLERMIDHMTKYDGDIDHSLRNRKLASSENLGGWHFAVKYCDRDLLDIMEKETLKECVANGFIPYNKTTGGQGQGKRDLGDKVVKGYQNGLHNGYNKARKDIAKLFNKNLVAVINGSTNKNKEKALEKFKEFITLE